MRFYCIFIMNRRISHNCFRLSYKHLVVCFLLPCKDLAARFSLQSYQARADETRCLLSGDDIRRKDEFDFQPRALVSVLAIPPHQQRQKRLTSYQDTVWEGRSNSISSRLCPLYYPTLQTTSTVRLASVNVKPPPPHPQFLNLYPFRAQAVLSELQVATWRSIATGPHVLSTI